MRTQVPDLNISHNLDLIDLSSYSLRAIGKLGHYCTLILSKFVSSSNLFNDLVGIALIVACDRCFVKTRPELSPKWHFFLTEPGKNIYFLIFALALLLFYSNMQSKPQNLGFASLSFTVLSFCLMQLHQSWFKIISFIMQKIPHGATIEQLRIYQASNRNIVLACSLALLAYSIILPFYFYDTDSRGISVVRLFISSSGVLFYWYLETLLLQMPTLKSEWFWLPMLFIVYKLGVAFWLMLQSDGKEFETSPKLKGFVFLISILFWVLGFLEVIVLNWFHQNNSSDSVAEENEDQIKVRMGSRLSNIEQSAQVFTAIFGVLWFACVINHESGLTYGFAGLSIILMILLWNYDMKASYFESIQDSKLRQKNSWKTASRNLFTGHAIFFFIQRSYNDKPSFTEKEITLSFMVVTMGFLTAAFYWSSGIYRFFAYTKKHICSAHLTNEDNAQIVFPSYKVRTTAVIKIISSVSNVLVSTANCLAISFALILFLVANIATSLTVTNHFALSCVVIFTSLVYSQVIQRVALPSAPYLTRTLLKGLVNLLLGLIFYLTNKFKVSENSSEFGIFLQFMRTIHDTVVCFYLLGGTFLIFLHGAKFESDQHVRQVTLPDGNTISLDQQETIGQNLTVHERNQPTERHSNRLIPNQQSLFSAKRSLSGEKKGKKHQRAAAQEKQISNLVLYYKAFAALAKGE